VENDEGEKWGGEEGLETRVGGGNLIRLSSTMAGGGGRRSSTGCACEAEKRMKEVSSWSSRGGGGKRRPSPREGWSALGITAPPSKLEVTKGVGSDFETGNVMGGETEVSFLNWLGTGRVWGGMEVTHGW